MEGRFSAPDVHAGSTRVRIGPCLEYKFSGQDYAHMVECHGRVSLDSLSTQLFPMITSYKKPLAQQTAVCSEVVGSGEVAVGKALGVTAGDGLGSEVVGRGEVAVGEELSATDGQVLSTPAVEA